MSALRSCIEPDVPERQPAVGHLRLFEELRMTPVTSPPASSTASATAHEPDVAATAHEADALAGQRCRPAAVSANPGAFPRWTRRTRTAQRREPAQPDPGQGRSTARHAPANGRRTAGHEVATAR